MKGTVCEEVDTASVDLKLIAFFYTDMADRR